MEKLTILKVVFVSSLIFAVSCLFFVLISGINSNKRAKTEAAFTITSSLSDSDYNNNTNFEISTLEGLKVFASKIQSGKDFSGKTVSLTQDINCNSEDITLGGGIEETIHSVVTQTIGSKHGFNGLFDGRSHILSNICLKTPVGSSESGYNGSTRTGFFRSDYYYAIFPYLMSKAIICNLWINNITVDYAPKTRQSAPGVSISQTFTTYMLTNLFQAGANVYNCGITGNTNINKAFNSICANCYIKRSDAVQSLGEATKSIQQTNTSFTTSNDISNISNLDNTYWFVPDNGNNWNSGCPMLKSFISSWKNVTVEIADENKDIGILSINGNQQSGGQGSISTPTDYTINTTFPNASQSLSIVGNTIITAPSSDNAEFVNWTKSGDVITAHLKLKPVAVTINIVDENGNAFSSATYTMNSTLNGATYTSTNGKYDIGVDITLTNITVTDNRYYLVGVYHDEISSGNKIQGNNGSYTHKVSNQTTIYIQVKLKNYVLDLN